jgi:hypothetical protein
MVQGQSAKNATDPTQFRRVLVPPDRLPGELERVRQGILVQLSREGFEKRVQTAMTAREALKNPPRLVEARYRAKLADMALSGTGEWRVVHRGHAGGVLAVTPLNLALQQVRWQATPAADAHDSRPAAQAVLGDLDGKNLGLLVDQPGAGTLSMDWTARSDPRPDGLYWDLQIPSCAIAILELVLPGDCIPTISSDGSFLSGPFPAEKPDQRTWHIAFSGRSQLNLVVRHAAGAASRGLRPPANGGLQPPARPLLLTQVQTIQELTPHWLKADFDFAVEVTQAGPRELLFACDPSLRPYEVLVRNLESWEVQPPKTIGDKATLVVRVREPFPGGTVLVHCQAPLSASNDWSCPGIELQGALARDNRVTLRIAPDLQLENWQPGSYRIVKSLTEADGSLVVHLTPAIFMAPRARAGRQAPVQRPVRPSARLQALEPEVRARQLAWWQVSRNGSTLTVQVAYDVARGRLYRLPVLIPPGWAVVGVSLMPDLLRNWTAVPDSAGTRLVVDLQGTLGPALAAQRGESPSRSPVRGRLTLRLRSDQPGDPAPAGAGLPFPQLRVLDAPVQEGTLAIAVDPAYQTNVATSLTAAAPEEKGPWGRLVPDYSFAFRGQPVTGSLRLHARDTRLRSRCSSDVVLSAGHGRMVTRLLLRPELGNPDSVNLIFSAPVAGPLQWKTEQGSNQIRSVKQLPAPAAVAPAGLFGARTTLGQAALLAATQLTDPVYHLTLSRPLREPLLVECSMDLRPQTDNGGQRRYWNIPLLLPFRADSLDGEVTLHLGRAELFETQSQGLREAAATVVARGPITQRTFHYQHSPVVLALSERVILGDRSSEAIADFAHLTTYAGLDGRLLHHYRFHVWNWRLGTIPVRLPAGSAVLAARSDGRWISRLATLAAEDGAIVVRLPIGAGPPLHRVELIYAADCATWRLWTRVDPPLNEQAQPFGKPELPVRLLSFRRTWRLPPGVVPLFPERFQRLPGSEPPSSWENTLGEWAALPLPFVVPSWLDLWGTAGTRHGGRRRSPEGDAADRQERLLAAAEAAVQKPPQRRKAWTLGELLDYVVDHPKGMDPLVVDAVGLWRIGIGPETTLPAPAEGNKPPWQLLGLSFVPCQSALLLTTRVQHEAWSSAETGAGTLPGSVEDAVAAAATHGHDPTNRFRSEVDWLNDKVKEVETAPSEGPAGIVQAAFAEDWAAWEPLASEGVETTLVLVRTDALTTLAMMLAVILIFVAWSLGRAPFWLRFNGLLLWLATGGVALLWLPASLRGPVAWPAGAAAVVALVWYCRTLAIRRATPAKPSSVVTGVTALILAACLPGHAAAPAPATVLIVPGPADSPSKQTVLAPPELLRQLEILARGGGAGRGGAVLVKTSYAGTVAGPEIQFVAEFQVHCLADNGGTLILPLAGIQLQEALTDGAPANPVILPPPQEGFTVEIKGGGMHTIVLRFTVSPTATATDQDLRLTIPEAAQSRLVLDLPPSVTDLHSVNCRGAQQVIAGPSRSRLEADLGRVNSLHVRWHLNGPETKPVALSVRELYLWHLHPAASSLFAVLQYTVKQGTIRELSLDLPADTEVRSVEVGRLENGTEDSGPRLQDWRLEGIDPGRQLHLEFQRPITGGVQVMLELVPRRPLATRFDLPLPAPRATRPAEGPGQEPLLAYHAAGLQVQVASHLRIAAADRQAFADAWRAAGMGEPSPDTHAYSFQRTAAGPPFLRLDLQTPEVPVAGVQNVAWTVGTQQAEVMATARLTESTGELAFVEWDIPDSLAVANVSGADVRTWSRTGRRLQVWLHHSVAATTLQLAGWIPRATAADRTRPTIAPGAPSPSLLQLPAVRLVTPKAPRTFIQVTSANDLALRPLEIKNLWPMPDVRPSEREFNWLTELPDYTAVFQVRPQVTRIEARVLTLAEVIDHNLAISSSVDCWARQGVLHTLKLRVRNWDSAELKLEAPGLEHQFEPRREAAGETWTLVLPPGTTGHYRCRLVAKVPWRMEREVQMPEVTVDGAATQDHWLELAGRELTAAGSRGLAPVRDVVFALRPWPAEAERIRRAGSAWKEEAAEWQLLLAPQYPAAGSVPVRVFLLDQEDAVVDGQHWIHQATFWLFHDGGTTLKFLLPPRIRVLSVVVDGVGVPPLQTEPEQLHLTLSGYAGARKVRLRWSYEEGAETLERPRLAAPRLEGLDTVPAVWTVHLPVGYRLESSENATGATAAELDRQRAGVQLQLSAVLAGAQRAGSDESLQAQWVTAQERFYRYCRFAAHRTDAAASSNVAVQDLRQRNLQLAQSHGLEALRAQAEREAFLPPSPPTAGSETDGASEAMGIPARRDDRLPQWGTPTYWQAGAGGAVPDLKLELIAAPRRLPALAASSVLVILLGGVWMASFFPRVVAAVRRTWPEQLVLLGCLGIALLGPAWVFVALVALGLAGRLLAVARWVGIAWQRPTLRPETAGSGVSEKGV